MHWGRIWQVSDQPHWTPQQPKMDLSEFCFTIIPHLNILLILYRVEILSFQNVGMKPECVWFKIE